MNEENFINQFLSRYYTIITVYKVKKGVTESYLSGRCKITRKTLDVNQICLETKLIIGDFVHQKIVDDWYYREVKMYNDRQRIRT